MVATLESQKIRIIERIIALNDVEKINEMDIFSKQIIEAHSRKFQSMSDEELLQDVEEAEKDFAEGRFFSHNEVKSIVKSWQK